MYLKRLYLRNFRNYAECMVEFSPKLNHLWGANAQGKTNLLEAIHFLTVGRSFRTSVSREVIRAGTDGFYLEAFFLKDGIEQRLRIGGDGVNRKIIYNDTVCPSAANLLGLLPSVLIEPDDDLVKGPPRSRRLFLDLQIAQVDPLYVHYLARYNRAMRQRNLLLRSQNIAGIESWEHEMAQAAGYVTAKRLETIERLIPLSQRLHQEIVGNTQHLYLQYHARLHAPPTNAEGIAKQYRALFNARERDIQSGNTTHGPHRDDLGIYLAERDMRSYGSEGEKRTLVAVLRLAGWHLLKEQIGEDPLMLIDDLGISLDQHRREKLLDYVSGLGQSFVTSPMEPSARQGAEHSAFEVVEGNIKFADLIQP